MQNITITYIGNHWTMKIKRGIGSDCFYIFSSFHRHPFLNSALKTSLFLKHLHFLSIKIVHCSVFQYTMITSAIKRVKVDWIRNKMRQNKFSLILKIYEIHSRICKLQFKVNHKNSRLLFLLSFYHITFHKFL